MLGGPIWGEDTVAETVMDLVGPGIPEDPWLFGHLRTINAE